MKLHFQSENLDLYGEGNNVFLALGQIEEKLKAIVGLNNVLTDDGAIEWDEVMSDLIEGNGLDLIKQYQRLDFSTPEDNFYLIVDSE